MKNVIFEALLIDLSCRRLFMTIVVAWLHLAFDFDKLHTPAPRPSSDSNNWNRLYISIKVIFWYSIMVKWKISYFDPWLVNKWRYEPHRRVQRNWEKKPPLVFSPLVFFLIRNAVSVEDGWSNECFTFGTKNVGSVEFHKEKRIICRRA